MPAAVLIGVDWGGTRLRAYRFSADGAVLDSRATEQGVSRILDGRFAEALGVALGDWTADGPVPLILCGMVGSRQGWIEAPYIPCPADLAGLASALAPLETPFGPALVAPGVSLREADHADVMRGEETQFLGALPAPDWSGVILHPGTHAKWARFEQGRLTSFRTFMTGELFELLSTHSVLRLLIEGDAHDDAAYDLGVTRALADPAITSLLFTARAEVLLGGLSGVAAGSYLSGLLVGAEVAGGLRSLDAATPLLLVGDHRLTDLYQRALAATGRTVSTVINGEDAVTRGLWRLHQETSAR